MPLGKTSYMSTVDYSTGPVESLTLTGTVKFCKRPPAPNPKWLVIATDAGEIRVFNNAGVLQPALSVDLGWNPDMVSINNADEPRVLVMRLSTLGIYCYKNGAQEWSVAGITNMNMALISDGYVHVLLNTGVAGTVGPTWRSLTDGSLVQGAYGASYTGASDLAVTQAGEVVWWVNFQAAAYCRIYKTSRTGGNAGYYHLFGSATGTSSGFRVKCSADGGLIIATGYHSFAPAGYEVALIRGADIAGLYEVTGQGEPALSVNPAGARAAYVIASTLNKLTSLGVQSSVALGASRAASIESSDITDDPFFIVALSNGNMEIYDDSLVKKATIAYTLADTPIIVCRRT